MGITISTDLASKTQPAWRISISNDSRSPYHCTSEAEVDALWRHEMGRPHILQNCLKCNLLTEGERSLMRGQTHVGT